MQTIFIQIPAYRDPDLPATIRSLIDQASYPHRLHFGICLQLRREDPDSWRPTAFPKHPFLRVDHLNAQDSKGCTWARHRAQQLFQNEDFTLQIDSHMRAVKNWDEKLIETWNDCGDPMAVLSVYPNSFQQPDTPKNADYLPRMKVKRFNPVSGLVTNVAALKHKIPEDQPEKPWPCAFVAGGFLFAKGEIVKSTPADPNIYFDGEEISLAARLWTRGHNIYSPNRQIMYHLYKAKDDENASVQHWDDHSQWHKLNRRSLVRVHALLNNLENAPSAIRQQPGDLDGLDSYGLGSSRSIEDYLNYAGINLKDKTISDKAKSGIFPAN